MEVPTIEVFKTNVPDMDVAAQVLNHLSIQFPSVRVNFDLSDCDHILRVKGTHFTTVEVMRAVNRLGFHCEVLE